MSRRKVKPTQLTRRPERQGSLPKGREHQSSRKRGARRTQPVDARLAPTDARADGQRASSVLDQGKARRGVKGRPSRGARRTKVRRRVARSPSLG
jgi:hypothetical protein